MWPILYKYKWLHKMKVTSATGRGVQEGNFLHLSKLPYTENKQKLIQVTEHAPYEAREMIPQFDCHQIIALLVCE